MVIEGFIGMQQIQSAYSYLHSVKRKGSLMLLEPLQAITQLAYLKACPIGTKLTIENNLLFIQIPNWHQGITALGIKISVKIFCYCLMQFKDTIKCM